MALTEGHVLQCLTCTIPTVWNLPLVPISHGPLHLLGLTTDSHMAICLMKLQNGLDEVTNGEKSKNAGKTQLPDGVLSQTPVHDVASWHFICWSNFCRAAGDRFSAWTLPTYSWGLQSQYSWIPFADAWNSRRFKQQGHVKLIEGRESWFLVAQGFRHHMLGAGKFDSGRSQIHTAWCRQWDCP